MSAGPVTVAAVDLGASSGRVMLGRVGPDQLELLEMRRLVNRPVHVGRSLYWDVLDIYRGVLDGLRVAGRRAPEGIDGVGVDSWGVDYGLIDASGALVGNPLHYRDGRTDGVMDSVVARLGAETIYATTGLQFLPFNTIYQLVAAVDTPQARAAASVLLMPDLISYWLSGSLGAEITNASTTQLLDVRGRRWATSLMTDAGLDPRLFPPLREPGSRIGGLLPTVAEETGLRVAVPVLAVGSHDTASAVVGVPAEGNRFAYISCGTWSLVGVELTSPVLTEASRVANFTNELGVDGTVRYLRNVTGLWPLQESLRAWEAAGVSFELPVLLREAATLPPFSAIVDVDDPVFVPPGDMPGRIADACRRTGQPEPPTPAATARCILDSLALAHRRAVRAALELSGRDVDVVHIVGGGARNGLLCQLTADACGLPVVAGPVEATALGNALVQARALGAVRGGLADLRALVRRSQALDRYVPTGDAGAWDAAERRLFAR